MSTADQTVVVPCPAALKVCLRLMRKSGSCKSLVSSLVPEQFVINRMRHQFTDEDHVTSRHIQCRQHQWVPEYMSGVDRQQFPLRSSLLRAVKKRSAPTPLRVNHFPLHFSLIDIRNTAPHLKYFSRPMFEISQFCS